MKQLTSYLRTMFGPHTILEEYHTYDNLPLYLTDRYHLFKLQVGANTYVLAKPTVTIKLNVNAIKKQITQIQKYTNLPSVLVLENLRLSQRNALIQAGIAFVIPAKQLYIPNFVMNLTETESSIEDYGEQFAAATQVVFSYLLLKQIKETNAHQLSEQLPYSVATINRALKELCYRKLLQTVGNGTRKQYIISSGMEFWENGKQYLFDPVRSQRYVKVGFNYHDFPMSNSLALSRMSFLNGENIRYYASSSQRFKTINKEDILNEYDVFDQNYSIVEIFRYDPNLLSNGSCIDVISLYAQFKDEKDERVQIEIERLVNKILW